MPHPLEKMSREWLLLGACRYAAGPCFVVIDGDQFLIDFGGRFAVSADELPAFLRERVRMLEREPEAPDLPTLDIQL